MAIEFSCPECDRSLKVKDDLAGKRVKCPGCQSAITIPDEEEEAPPPKKKPAIKPAPKRQDEDEDERPVKKSARRDEDEEDERPKKKAARREDDQEDDRPRKRRDEDEEDDRPRRKKKAVPAKSSLPLILAIAGGVVLLAGIGVGIWWMTSGTGKAPPIAGGGDKGKTGGDKDKDGKDSPKKDGGGLPSFGSTAFLDEKKSVPPGAEWTREVGSRTGGMILFKIASSQKTFKFWVVTPKGLERIKAGGLEGLGEEVLTAAEGKGEFYREAVVLPAGSSYFVIRNDAGVPAEISLQCFPPN